MRILIAEDDQVLADGLLRSLRAAGYAVDQVGSGTEADAGQHEFPPAQGHELTPHQPRDAGPGHRGNGHTATAVAPPGPPPG